ncbi:MAG: helix-turn-helix transcriptional regulator [Clostridia bacterium]|nr:helix-turn-helix transcriptional regulator [Clostridia bacterium]
MQNENTVIADVKFFKTDFSRVRADVNPRGFSSLTLRLGGKVKISSGGVSLVSGANSVTFMPKGCAYSTQVIEPGEMLVMHFWTLGDSAGLGDVPMSDSPKFLNGFTSLYERALRHTSSGNSFACMADAYRLLSEAHSLFLRDGDAPSPKMTACKDYLDANIFDTELRVSDIAAIYDCSEVYFRRQFKKYYGTSPLEYIKKRRIEAACQLLETGLYSVTEVAMRSGFDSISYFSAEFHRAVGCSPKNYLK